MADNSTTTIRASFGTRAAADLAVEHVVQQMGIPRVDIFIQSATSDNTVGSAPSGGDASDDRCVRDDALLAGEIEVSADIAESDVAGVHVASDAGAIRGSDR